MRGVDCYVNDAFGAAHRAHASIVGPPRTLPSAAGRLIQREVEVVDALRSKPKRPLVAVLGGAKVSDKLGVIDALVTLCDQLLIGGGMCFTFLAAQGHPVGDSICERDQVDHCRDLLAKHPSIMLPEDIIGLDADGVYATFGRRLPDGAKGMDIGPGTAAAFGDAIMEARSVFWNGPMGVFEDARFAKGTRTVLRRWQTRKHSPWSAGETPPRRSRSSVSPTTSTTCRPAAAHRSSSSSSATCPACAH